ncbi:PREDICTED: ubiquitin-conjugating enzyme E2 variant 3 isoform X3 [Chinchilla lanigera]|uniref:ubiquitin-conjugating enzyme E2 variant 3 isoform X3 n=1 Tax=Chinchilla lanigera TaxID=34839 RepID=UPI000696F6C8|nr:PREDICTED: ubiquitin-conjugating enzyme E2 variant 3 isoform X3 [Chinchilla lanigera]
MEFDCEGVRRLLGKYKFRDLTVEELKNVNMFFPHFRYSMDTYVFKDSSQKDLLNFTGTIPVKYQGNTYNIPVRFWILDSHPFAPPICFLKPTANMGITVGKHVDAQGRIYLPYLQNWSHGIADKLVLLDCSEGTKGGTMDLDIFSLPNVEISKDLSASAHSKVVIFTVNSLGRSESYLDVVQSNVDMFRALVPALAHYSQHAVLVVASQPVEIMTYVTWKLSTFPANQVIGIGCNLDSQRLQYIITNVLNAQTSGKEVWVIGEQGEDKVPTWGGQEVVNHSSQAQLCTRAMELLRVKGQRSWSVGLSVADLVDSVVNNKKKVHSVSTLAKGYYDINSEVFLSLPCILGTGGVSEVIKTSVTEVTVTEKLQSSASSIHGLQQQLKL